MFSHLPNRIVYVRHPQCRHNISHAEYSAAIAEGVTNRASPLTVLGKIQADITAQYLLDEFGTFDLVVASDFDRTHAIPRRLGQLFIIDHRIGERWHGELHERGSVFFKDYPHEVVKYRSDYYLYKAPGGESCPDVETRLAAFLADESLLAGNETVLLSGHGMSGLCLRKLLMEATINDWQRWFKSKDDELKNASVTVYQRHGDYYDLIQYNHIPWEGKLEAVAGVAA